MRKPVGLTELKSLKHNVWGKCSQYLQYMHHIIYQPSVCHHWKLSFIFRPSLNLRAFLIDYFHSFELCLFQHLNEAFKPVYPVCLISACEAHYNSKIIILYITSS